MTRRGENAVTTYKSLPRGEAPFSLFCAKTDVFICIQVAKTYMREDKGEPNVRTLCGAPSFMNIPKKLMSQGKNCKHALFRQVMA